MNKKEIKSIERILSKRWGVIHAVEGILKEEEGRNLELEADLLRLVGEYRGILMVYNKAHYKNKMDLIGLQVSYWEDQLRIEYIQ